MSSEKVYDSGRMMGWLSKMRQQRRGRHRHEWINRRAVGGFTVHDCADPSCGYERRVRHRHEWADPRVTGAGFILYHCAVPGCSETELG